ncbi:MAG TPA: IS481 family transposase [Ruminiclostridium sp.]|nr:IS481 family transposase [Ruminiclostridium sp.]
MTVQDRIVKNKMSLLELAEYLQSVSEACKIHGVSRQHFYDIKKAYEAEGIEGLKDKTRRKPCIKNRVAPEIEEAVLKMAYEKPAYGQLRASNELRKQGVLVSGGGVRSIWLRYGVETFEKRLKKLEEKAAKEGILYTEDQLAALEKAKQEKSITIDEIDTQHPGYLVSQDTFYVGYIKGVGRIYQQTVIDTYSTVGFAKLYTAKIPVTAADILNERVLPFFETHMIPVMRVLTDRGTEYCGAPEKHYYELFLQLNEIEHTMTKAKSPQTNGICERFNQTVLNEFYRIAFRKNVYKTIEQLQEDLDFYILQYNEERTHQGKRCKGRTPMKTFLDSLQLAKDKIYENQIG